MASGAWIFPDKCRLNFANATNLLNATGANFRCALVTSSYTPNTATHEVWADVSANEIANGNGYTTGGVALSSVTLAISGTSVKFTCATISWTASGGSIPVWRRAVIYYLGTLNSKVNPILGYCLGDSTPADVPATTDGNTVQIVPHANGILTM